VQRGGRRRLPRGTWLLVVAGLGVAGCADAPSDAPDIGADVDAGEASVASPAGAAPVTVAGSGADPDRILTAARDIVSAVPWASLATVDAEGWPRVRVMDAAPPDEDFVVRLATNPRSAKVRQIGESPGVALHWVNPAGPSYVTLLGEARLLDSAIAITRFWQESWDPFYPNAPNDVVLIEVRPVRLEVVSVPHGLEGDTVTWAADAVAFGSAG
jgi:general stress protein 26